MLNDTVIQFFRILFGGKKGLQDTLFGQRLSFKIARNYPWNYSYMIYPSTIRRAMPLGNSEHLWL